MSLPDFKPESCLLDKRNLQLLSVKANTVYNTLEARNSLLTALEQSAQIETMLRGEPSTVIQLALDTDGYLVAASYGYYVYIWNLQTRQLSKLRLEDKEFVEGIGLSADGQTLVTASAAGVWVWAIQTRTGIPPTGTRRTQLEEKMVSVPADVIPDTPMVFSSDKQLVAYGRCSQFSSDGGSFVCVKTQVSVKKIHGLLLCSFIVLGDVNSLTLNQDGTILASRSNKGVQLWNATTGQSMGSLPADATNTTSISFNSSGTMLVYSKGTSIQFWDVAKRRPFGPPFTGHAEQITSIAFSFDGTMMASSSLDRTVHLWSMSPGEVLSGQSLKILTGDAEPKMSVAFSGDGKTLAFGGEDGTIILWKTGATSAISPTIGKEAYGLRSALLSPDGTTLITGDEQGNIFLQHAGTGELLATLDDTMVAYPLLKQKPGRDLNNLASIQSLALSDDGGILAAGRLDGTVTLWNVKTRTPLTHFCYPDQLHKIALSANGQILAAGGIGDTIVLWSVTKGLIHTFSHLTVSPSSTLPVALSPKGTLLVTGSCAKEENGNCKQGQILLWNVVTGQPFGHRLLGHSSDISDVAFSPDERTLAASSEDGIMLWDTVIGNPIMPMLTLSADTHNTKYYDHILFSPDGNRLASYSSPGNVPFSFVVWDVGQHEPLVEKAFQEEDTIQGSVAFNRDGQQLAVVFKRSDSGSIGTFKKWNISIQSWQMVACHIANRNLHRNE